MLNSSINEQLAAAANVKEGDVVLEIGPGTGSLTNVLINSGATVLAVEKVSFFFFFVPRFVSDFCQISIHEPRWVKCASKFTRQITLILTYTLLYCLQFANARLIV